MSELEKKLGYTFRDPELLALALTHSSWSNERGLGHKGCNVSANHILFSEMHLQNMIAPMIIYRY